MGEAVRSAVKSARAMTLALLLLALLSLPACNLARQRPAVQELQITRVRETARGIPTVTPQPAAALPTAVIAPTRVSLPPTALPIPVNTAAPLSIGVQNPASNSIISGSVQILGSATHPELAHYYLEYASQPNPGNLWHAITGALGAPVQNGLLATWHTADGNLPDGVYQLRLRVFLYSGGDQSIVVSNLHLRNQRVSAAQPVAVSLQQAPTATAASPNAPVAIIEASPLSGRAPLRVEFRDLSSGEISYRSWTFGDRSGLSSEANPAHTFAAAGSYNVELRVTGPGGESQAVRQIVVTAPLPPAPVAAFTGAPLTGPAPLTVAFTNQSTNADIGYVWDFDADGGPDSTEINPSWTFEARGVYRVRLVAAGAGGSSEATVDVIVQPPIQPPGAFFVAEPASGIAPLTVSFSNQTSGEVSAYAWDFQSDGVYDSSEAAPNFTFATPGEYVVVLEATGPGGSSQYSLTISALEAVAAPVAGFTSSASNLSVAFQSTAAGENRSYAWDFGDGAAASDANPTHTYLSAGSYQVTQTVSNAGGSDSFTADVIVSEPPAPLTADVGEIAFVSDRDGNNEIYLMKGDGTGARNLTNHPANDRHPSWSPDGARLAFASRRDDDNFDIYLLEIETLAVTRLTTEGNNNRPAFSPDGSRIAFVSDRFGDKDLFVMNADGSGQIQLTVDISDEDQPTWSPDGSLIAYAGGAVGERNLFVIQASDGAAHSALTSAAGDNFHPSWLPDAMRSLLAFTSTRTGNEEIFVIDPLTGGDLRQLTNAASVDAAAELVGRWQPAAHRVRSRQPGRPQPLLAAGGRR